MFTRVVEHPGQPQGLPLWGNGVLRVAARLKERYCQGTTLDSRLRGNDGMVSGNDGMVSGKDGMVSGKDGMVSGKDGMVSGKDGMVSGKDGMVSAPSFEIVAKCAIASLYATG